MKKFFTHRILACIFFYAQSAACFDAAQLIRKTISMDDAINGIWHNHGDYDAQTITQVRCVNKYLNNFVDGTYQYICDSQKDSTVKILMQQSTPLLGLCNKSGELCYVTRPKQLKGDDFFYTSINVFAGNRQRIKNLSRYYDNISGFTLFQFIKANKVSFNIIFSETLDCFKIKFSDYPVYSRENNGVSSTPIEMCSPEINVYCSLALRKPGSILVTLGSNTPVTYDSDLLFISSFYALYRKCSAENDNVSILVNPYHRLFKYNHKTQELKPLFFEPHLQYFDFCRSPSFYKLDDLESLQKKSLFKNFDFWHQLSKKNTDAWVEKNNILSLIHNKVYFRAIDLSQKNYEWSCNISRIEPEGWYVKTIVNRADKLFFSLKHKQSPKYNFVLCIGQETSRSTFNGLMVDPSLYTNGEQGMESPKQLTPVFNAYNHMDYIMADKAEIFIRNVSPRLLFTVDLEKYPNTPTAQQLLDDLLSKYDTAQQCIQKENFDLPALPAQTVKKVRDITVTLSRTSFFERTLHNASILHKQMLYNSANAAQTPLMLERSEVFIHVILGALLGRCTNNTLLFHIGLVGLHDIGAREIARRIKAPTLPFQIGIQLLGNAFGTVTAGCFQPNIIRLLAPAYWLAMDLFTRVLLINPLSITIGEAYNSLPARWHRWLNSKSKKT